MGHMIDHRIKRVIIYSFLNLNIDHNVTKIICFVLKFNIDTENNSMHSCIIIIYLICKLFDKNVVAHLMNNDMVAMHWMFIPSGRLLCKFKRQVLLLRRE